MCFVLHECGTIDYRVDIQRAIPACTGESFRIGRECTGPILVGGVEPAFLKTGRGVPDSNALVPGDGGYVFLVWAVG